MIEGNNLKLPQISRIFKLKNIELHLVSNHLIAARKLKLIIMIAYNFLECLSFEKNCEDFHLPVRKF